MDSSDLDTSPTFEFILPDTLTSERSNITPLDSPLDVPMSDIPPIPMLKPKVFKRIPDLYFPDGNIILEAGMTHFRVSRGILAARSPVFREVLSLPQPKNEGEGEGGDGKVDGCDVVHLFGDDPHEVEWFLKAIYDSRYAIKTRLITR